MGKSWSLCALLLLACSAESNGVEESENVARTSDRVVLSSTANCTIELTKIDYDQVGADTGDYIELKVTKKNDALVTTLTDCGVGAIALYDDSSVVVPGVCLPYSLTALVNIAIPADGYIEVGQGAGSTVAATIGSGSASDGWIHNGRGEIAILSAALPNGVPTSWFQFEGDAKCNLLALPVTQIPAENDSSPNFTNVSCDATFHLVDAANAIPKTNADCPSGGAGGAGGASGGTSNGGSAGLLGSAGLSNSSGAGGLLNLGGLSNLGGSGGALSNGGSAGVLNASGTANSGGASGAFNGTGGEAGALGGDAGTSAGGASGGSTVGDAGEAGGTGVAQGGNENQAGGNSTGANAGKAGSGESGADSGHAGHGMVTEGGGCSCSVPSAPNKGRARALIAIAALLGLCLRRRHQALN